MFTISASGIVITDDHLFQTNRKGLVDYNMREEPQSRSYSAAV